MGKRRKSNAIFRVENHGFDWGGCMGDTQPINERRKFGCWVKYGMLFKIIQHPSSSIQHPASSIQHRGVLLNKGKEKWI
jgi:hypothetical protein